MGLVSSQQPAMPEQLQRFNAASPAMGLVSIGRSEKRVLRQFQCCFACNGFSICMLVKPKRRSQCFNAASPAMGLVYMIDAFDYLTGQQVSMLLRLQWV